MTCPRFYIDVYRIRIEVHFLRYFGVCQYRRMSNLPLIQPEEVLCCPPLAERALSPAEAERTAAMFKALGDPVRLRLFSLIVSRPAGEACVCEISDVGVSQPTVSHHLRKLKEAGLLTSQRRGTWVYYRAAPEVVRAMARMLMGA
jgi:ArsR family transcriptional regulator